MTKNNITLQISGGLGNQMFQYATAYAVAKKNGYNLRIDISSYDSYIWNEICGLELNRLVDDFNINKPFYFALLSAPNPFKTFAKMCKKTHQRIGRRFIEKKEFSYDKHIFDIAPNTKIFSFCQSYKYFDNIKNQIQKIYGDFPLSQAGKKILNDIKKQQQSVALHYREYTSVRSGNLETAKALGELDLDYYKKAIAIIRKTHPQTIINVFSNNIIQAKDVLKGFSNINFVKYDFENNWEDMMLMKHCKHNIIANSSYSWWSAYLNQNPDKIVIAPKSWGNMLKGREDDNDLFPSDWITI